MKKIYSLFKKFQDRQDRLAAPHIEKARHGGIWAIYRLFNRYYIKSFFGPFFLFAFPVLIYSILGNLMDYKLMFPGVVALAALSSGINGMPFSIMELKKSVLLKRIGASPVKPSKFTIVIITYFTFMILLSVLWLMAWSVILFQRTSLFKPMGTIVGFFGFFYGNVLNILVSLALGFAIATVAKSENGAQAIGMLIYFPSAFLSGHFITIDIIARVKGMEWVSRFIPFRYTTMIIIESWSGDMNPGLVSMAQVSQSAATGNPFLIHDFAGINTKLEFIDDIGKQGFTSSQDILNGINKHKWAIIIYDKADHIVAYIVPYLMLIGFGWFSVRNFRWSAAR